MKDPLLNGIKALMDQAEKELKSATAKKYLWRTLYFSFLIGGLIIGTVATTTIFGEVLDKVTIGILAVISGMVTIMSTYIKTKEAADSYEKICQQLRDIFFDAQTLYVFYSVGAKTDDEAFTVYEELMNRLIGKSSEKKTTPAPTFYTDVAKPLSQRIIMSGENARLVEGVKKGAK
jgi:capsule polysaccharide export protein KpsE/RkpR